MSANTRTFLSRAHANFGIALTNNKGIVSELILNRKRAETQFMEAE
jgi:hypothetical protein